MQMIQPPDWITTSLAALNQSFSGRLGSDGYDATKLYQIHRRNRAFVWKHEHQMLLLDSILKGYVIPPIYCSSKIVDGREVRYIMEGGNRTTTIRRLLNGEVRELTPEERAIVERTHILVCVYRGLTPRQEREQFRRLNKNIKVSDGQLFAMSEEDSPLVREAVALLEDVDHPLRATITDLFYDTRGADDDGKSKLSNAVALVSGALYGVSYITKSFNQQELKVEDQTQLNRTMIAQRLNAVFEVYRRAAVRCPLEDLRVKKAQLTVGGPIGVMLYDFHMNPDTLEDVQKKWTDFVCLVRQGDAGATEIRARRIWGANLNPTRHKRISALVDTYLRLKEVLTDQQLKLIKHPRPEEYDDSSEEDAD